MSGRKVDLLYLLYSLRLSRSYHIYETGYNNYLAVCVYAKDITPSLGLRTGYFDYTAGIVTMI